jgi:hypothetical protein
VEQEEREWHSQAPSGIVQEEHMLGDRHAFHQILGSCLVVPKMLRGRYAIIGGFRSRLLIEIE